MYNSEKTAYGNDWHTYQEKSSHLEKHKLQAYLLILRQCTQLLKEKTKQDTAWYAIITSYNCLTLLQLIETTTLVQTEDRYPFATVYDNDLTFYTFHQVSMSNPQWYECFTTKIDISESIGVTHQHKTLLEYVVQEAHSLAFGACMENHQAAVHIDSEEHYLS